MAAFVLAGERAGNARQRNAFRRVHLPCGLSPSPESLVNHLQVKCLRVEFAADPIEHPLVFGMFWVLDRFQKVPVAPRTAAVLRRAGTLALDAAGVAGTAFGGQGL